MQLLKDQVLIEPAPEKEKTTPSGIIIPDTAEKHGLLEGTITEVGGGRYADTGQLIPMQVQKGQKVLFEEGFNAKRVKFEGKEYIIVREDDIRVIL